MSANYTNYLCFFSGDWFCPRCHPEDYIVKRKRKRAIIIEESEDEEEEEEEETDAENDNTGDEFTK